MCPARSALADSRTRRVSREWGRGQFSGLPFAVLTLPCGEARVTKSGCRAVARAEWAVRQSGRIVQGASPQARRCPFQPAREGNEATRQIPAALSRHRRVVVPGQEDRNCVLRPRGNELQVPDHAVMVSPPSRMGAAEGLHCPRGGRGACRLQRSHDEADQQPGKAPICL